MLQSAPPQAMPVEQHPIDHVNLSEQPQKNEVNHTAPANLAAPPPPNTLPIASQTPVNGNSRDPYGYEDEWDGWDGPIWCSRYGRFESQKDARRDDGDKYAMRSENPYQDIERAGCDCKVPGGHKSYVRDIQRRVEPMVDSLVKLEAKVEELLQHIKRDAKAVFAHEHTAHETKAHENRTGEWSNGKPSL